MADYYPLLAKAIAGLPDASPEARRAIYERARKALISQLRAHQPPVPEANIEAESKALDQAVAKLEAELAAKPKIDSKPDSKTAADPIAPPPVSAPPPATPTASEPPAPAKPLSAPPPMPPGANGASEQAPAPGWTGLKRPAAPNGEKSSAEPLATAEEGSADLLRPFAPQPKIERTQPKQLWIVGAAVAFVVVLVAFAAWKLRDRPEDLANLQADHAPSASDGGSKIIDRIGGGTITSSLDTPSDGVKTGGTAQETPQAQEQASSPATANPGVPQPGRAALLMEAPEEPNKVKTATGTVTWRRETIANDPNGPLDVAVRADIDIPSLKLQVAVIFQKNTDLNLPASHTIKINFAVAPDSPVSSIKQINVPQMRREDTANGDVLGGVPVPITDNAFLVGLSRGSSESINISLIKERPWIDVPLMLGNGKIAKLTFEKGAAGQQAFDEALAAWAQP